MKLLSLLLVFISSYTFSQVSLSRIKTLGINSENDLKKIGISQSEIDNAKAKFLEQNSKQEKKEVKKEVKTKKPQEIKKPVIRSKYDDVSKVFGHSYFKEGYFNLKQNTHRMNPPGNYILGPGDNISITIWGASEFGNEFTLDEFGNITPKIVGRINLRGLTFSNAKQIIKSRFAKVYNLRSSKISINLTYSKIISVNIVGEVKKPGTYSIPGVNSAFNLISLAGGVTSLGTVRKIEIRRDGQVVSVLDLYKFILNPKNFSDIFLQEGDYIIVKTQGGIVNVKGEVKRPGEYEVTNEDKLDDIINIAGNFSTYANKENINVKRIVGNKWIFENYKLGSSEYKNLSLGDGGEIEVLKISNIVYGLVKITGAINVEGEYSYVRGMKVRDLIYKAGKLNKNSYQNHAQLFRTLPDLSLSVIKLNLKEIISNPNSAKNITLQENDSIVIFDKSKLNFSNLVTVRGALQKTGTTPFVKGLTLNDIILKFNGLKMEADRKMIEVERLRYSSADSNKSYVELIKVQYPSHQDFEIKPNDIINFRTLPRFTGQESVFISGEIKYPGRYTLNGSNEKLSDLIERAGGVTSWAFLEGSKLQRHKDSLGLILMNLKHVLKNKDSKYNYILNSNDSVIIPKTSNIVSISGAIGYKFLNKKSNLISSPFHKNRRAGFYIKKYGGGYSKNAKRGRVYVIGSNGLVKESTFFGQLKPKIKSGDKIIVQTKEKRKTREQGKEVDWNSVIEHVTIKATAILTLLVLTQQAFN